MKQFSIHYDTEYGCFHRKGWSVFINQSMTAELERFLIVALIKSFWKYYFVWGKEYRE